MQILERGPAGAHAAFRPSNCVFTRNRNKGLQVSGSGRRKARNLPSLCIEIAGQERDVERTRSVLGLDDEPKKPVLRMRGQSIGHRALPEPIAALGRPEPVGLLISAADGPAATARAIRAPFTPRLSRADVAGPTGVSQSDSGVAPASRQQIWLRGPVPASSAGDGRGAPSPGRAGACASSWRAKQAATTPLPH